MKTRSKATLLLVCACVFFSGCERKKEYCVYDDLTGQKLFCEKLTEEEYNVRSAKKSIAAIQEAMMQFALDNGQIPSQEQGIAALVIQPEGINTNRYLPHGYLKRILDDPWGNPFQYAVPAQRSNDAFDVFSFGPDGNPNTDDDIGNWN